MASSAPTLATRWEPLPPRVVAELLGPSSARWWLSGGVALDHWLGTYTREHGNIDASTTIADLPQLLQDLPAPFSAWAPGDGVLPWAEADMDADLQPIRIHDDATGAWVLQVDVEDGTDRVWVYRRDPRLQLPWDRAVWPWVSSAPALLCPRRLVIVLEDPGLHHEPHRQVASIAPT